MLSIILFNFCTALPNGYEGYVFCTFARELNFFKVLFRGPVPESCPLLHPVHSTNIGSDNLQNVVPSGQEFRC